MTEKTNIRLADLADLNDGRAIVELLESYAAEPGGGGATLAKGVRDQLPAALSRQPQARVWLAFRGEQPVGVAVCFLGFSTFAAAPLLNLHDLAVHPKCRGLGIGTTLLETVEAEARAWGCCKITLEVRADNPRAEDLYRRLGFVNPGADSEHTKTHFLAKRL